MKHAIMEIRVTNKHKHKKRMTKQERQKLVDLAKSHKAQDITDICPWLWYRFGLNRNNEGKINFIINLLYTYHNGYRIKN